MSFLQLIGIVALAAAAWSFANAVRRGYFPLESDDNFSSDDEQLLRTYRSEKPIAFWWHTISWSLIVALVGLILLFLGG